MTRDCVSLDELYAFIQADVEVHQHTLINLHLVACEACRLDYLHLLAAMVEEHIPPLIDQT
ncbi:MAG: hypothetical protein AB1489_18370 [Acidobacteriota bacterium]